MGFTNLHLEAWVYSSGFPKSHNVSKSIDKMLGAKRGTKRIKGARLMRMDGRNTRPWMEEAIQKGYHEMPDDTPITEEAKAWVGWGTALKPAWEPVIVGTK